MRALTPQRFNRFSVWVCLLMCLDVRMGHFRGVTEEGTRSSLEKYRCCFQFPF